MKLKKGLIGSFILILISSALVSAALVSWDTDNPVSHSSENIKITIAGSDYVLSGIVEALYTSNSELPQAGSLVTWNTDNPVSHSAEDINTSVDGAYYTLQSVIDSIYATIEGSSSELVPWVDGEHAVWHSSENVRIEIAGENNTLQSVIESIEAPIIITDLSFELNLPEGNGNDYDIICRSRDDGYTNDDDKNALFPGITAPAGLRNRLYILNCKDSNEDVIIPDMSIDLLIGPWTEILTEKNRHVNSMTLFGIKTFDRENDTFKYYIRRNSEGTFDIKVRRVESCWTDVTEPEYVCIEGDPRNNLNCMSGVCDCRYTSGAREVVCETDELCPKYTVPRPGIFSGDIYNWKEKDLTCSLVEREYN